MNLTFSQRAERLTELNNNDAPFIDNSPVKRIGNLTYLQPGEIWRKNDFYESGGEVLVLGTSSPIKTFTFVSMDDMHNKPRRYTA